MVKVFRSVVMDEVASSLSIRHCSTHKIIHEDFRSHNVCRRWIPGVLTTEHKNTLPVPDLASPAFHIFGPLMGAFTERLLTLNTDIWDIGKNWFQDLPKVYWKIYESLCLWKKGHCNRSRLCRKINNFIKSTFV